ncbi:hypothetical protein PN486_15635 [Nodularia spumigena CS-587/03]|uniref:hypothetical protein n=1 Tax=Nodularia spumigena TaxID=70799 RepID=UPI00232F409F|nr:hypothetical protein [Nodularia spumigena]MDB9357656.1 hypothetical protein [Nodularia spumigena CS-587/03]
MATYFQLSQWLQFVIEDTFGRLTPESHQFELPHPIPKPVLLVPRRSPPTQKPYLPQ